MKHYLLILACYLAFTWQAALRPELACYGYAPNFLVLAVVLVMWSLTDITGLIAVAALGLLSDCLATRSLGNDMLCFVAVGILLQMVCSPRLVRHPGWLLGLVLIGTVLIEVSTTFLRGTLNHELPQFDASYLRWVLTAFGDGCYTAVLATGPVWAMIVWGRRSSESSHQPALGRWHRLTS